MLYLLLLTYLNLFSLDTTWQIPQEYNNKLEGVNKFEFYSHNQWNGFSDVQRKAIRNILICKHAEMRYAPVHTLQLKIFNSFVKNVNQAVKYSLIADCDSVSIKTPSNPLFHWVLYSGLNLKNALQGEYRYHSGNDGDFTYAISQDAQQLIIPYTDANYCDKNNAWNVKTIEKFIWENNILRINRCHTNGSYEIPLESFVPLKNVHSICTLYPVEFRGYIAGSGRSKSEGLLITLKNGLQMVWNREEKQLYPVGFCRQYNTDEDSYDYCQRLHTNLFTIRKPSQVFERLCFKKFIWATPQQRYMDELKSRFFAGLRNVCIAGAMCWALWRGTIFGKELMAHQLVYDAALESWKRELAEKNIKIPTILDL